MKNLFCILLILLNTSYVNSQIFCIELNDFNQFNANSNYFRVGCDKGSLSIPFFVTQDPNFPNCKTASMEIKIEVYKKFYKLLDPKLKVLVDAGSPGEHINYFPITLTITETSMMYIYEGTIPAFWDQVDDKILSLE